MSDYNTTFLKRGAEYMHAINKYPNALSIEFQTAAQIVLDTNPSVVLNMMAGGVPLDKYLPSNIQYHAFECNKEFAEMTGTQYCTLMRIDMPDNSVDTIVNIASLHHSSDSERALFYKECLRILKPGGHLVIGDVIKETPQDAWLNTFVDRFNSRGHKGNFWSSADCNLLRDSGFNNVVFKTLCYDWSFENMHCCIDFSKYLFGLDLATAADIYAGLTELLAPQTKNGKVTLPWKLGYFVSQKGLYP